MTKFTRNEIDAVITSFTTAAQKKYDNYAYASGFLSTMFALAVERLPTAQQAELLKHMMQQTNELYGEVEV